MEKSLPTAIHLTPQAELNPQPVSVFWRWMVPFRLACLMELPTMFLHPGHLMVNTWQRLNPTIRQALETW
jgi:hypothetical protein